MLTFFFLPFFSSLIWSGAASAEAPRPPREATWEARFTLSYFDTTENFTSSGRETLLNGGEYTNLLGDFRYTYDWQADWRFYGSLNIARADSALASNAGVNPSGSVFTAFFADPGTSTVVSAPAAGLPPWST